MTLKSIHLLLFIGTTLTPVNSFASGFSLLHPSTWGSSCCTQKQVLDAVRTAEDVGEAGLEISLFTLEKAAIPVTIDLIQKNYSKAGIDAMAALSLAIHTYAETHNSAPMALAALSGVVDTTSANLDQNGGKSLTISATALATGVLNSVASANPGSTPEEQLVKVLLILTQSILDDFKDDEKLNISDKTEYKRAFDQVFTQIPALMPNVNPSIILNLQAAFDNLFDGNGDSATLIASAKMALAAFHIAHPTTPAQIAQNTIAQLGDTVIDGISGSANLSADMTGLSSTLSALQPAASDQSAQATQIRAGLAIIQGALQVGAGVVEQKEQQALIISPVLTSAPTTTNSLS